MATWRSSGSAQTRPTRPSGRRGLPRVPRTCRCRGRRAIGSCCSARSPAPTPKRFELKRLERTKRRPSTLRGVCRPKKNHFNPDYLLPMKIEIRCLASLITLLAASTGCMNTSRYKSLPVEWAKAIERTPNSSLNLSGQYANGGQNRGVKIDVGSPVLQELFFARKDLATHGSKVEIRQRDLHTIEVTIPDDSKALAQKRVSVEMDTATGAFLLRSRDASLAHGQGLMAMAGVTVVRLYRPCPKNRLLGNRVECGGQNGRPTGLA